MNIQSTQKPLLPGPHTSKVTTSNQPFITRQPPTLTALMNYYPVQSLPHSFIPRPHTFIQHPYQQQMITTQETNITLHGP